MAKRVFRVFPIPSDPGAVTPFQGIAQALANEVHNRAVLNNGISSPVLVIVELLDGDVI